MTRLECDVCGLAAMDLPDGVDPEQFFETTDSGKVTHCPTCEPAAALLIDEWGDDL